MTWADEPSYHPVTPVPPPAPVPIHRDRRDDREPITIPAPPPVPQLARERDEPADDGLWKGDELLADDTDPPAPSAFGDHHRAPTPSWPPAPRRSSLIPAALPSRRVGTSDTGRWLVAALLAAIATLVTWHWLTPTTGSLEIRLADAERHLEVDVLVDGVSRCGTTPCRLSDVSAGSHLVEIGAGDGRWLRRRVEVSADEHSLISLAFPREPSPDRRIGQGVELRSELSPVKVTIDGERRGTLPILIDDLSTGEHRLVFESPGRRPLEQTVTVNEGQLVRLHDIALAPGKGALRVALHSPGARVLVGRAGQQTGRRPLYGPWPQIVELDTQHDWEIVAGGSGYRAKVFPVRFDDEGRGSVDVRLEIAEWTADDIY